MRPRPFFVKRTKVLIAWFWAVDGGNACIAVKYGNKVVELARCRTAVETNATELKGRADYVEESS